MNSKPLQTKQLSLLNFRDVGGLPASGRGAMREGLIFRSANPDRIKKRDLEMLLKLGLKTVIDLRGARESTGKKSINGVETIPMPLDFELRTRERLRPVIRKKNAHYEIEKISNDLYLEILDAIFPVLKRTVEVILTPGKMPLLIHCQAGKDRTGILAALLQLAAGVERELIIGDYLRSNQELIPFFRKVLLFRKIITLGTFPSSNVLYAVTVKRKNIESVLDRVDLHYGGIESFMLKSGLDRNQIEDFRNLIIANNS